MAEIWISGSVGWDLTAQSVAEQLRPFAGEDLTINLNTPGGSVYEGFEIYNLISQYPGRKIMKLGSLVASIGAYIACAGDEIIVKDFTSYMIHEGRMYVEGTGADMKAEAERLERLNNLYASRLSQVTGKSDKQIREWMKAETWFYGQEIVDAGFAHRLEDTGRKEEKSVAVALAREQYRRVASLKPTDQPLATQREKQTSWIDDAKALIESGKFNAVDESGEVIRNGIVMRTALRRIVSRAPNGDPEVASLISMIDKVSRKEKKVMDKNEILEAILREPSLTLGEIAKTLNQSARLATEEQEAALKVLHALKALNVSDPVAEIKAMQARIEELAKSERSVAITESFGAPELGTGETKVKNLVREYADERIPKAASGEALTAAILEVKNSEIAKRLAGEMADPYSGVNRIESQEPVKTPGSPVAVEY